MAAYPLSHLPLLYHAMGHDPHAKWPRAEDQFMNLRIPTSSFSLEGLAGSDFQAAAAAVLAFMRDRIGFGLWMVTRVDGDDWIVLTAEDHGYGVAAGNLFKWSDSFCSRMVVGNGPRVAANVSIVPVYVDAPIGQQVPIGAYVGVPIQAGGELFGTLCAINPTAMPDSIQSELPLIELLAGLLGNILVRERTADVERRRAERAEVESLSDALTGLTNRRGWDELLSREESRAKRYGDPATVIVIDLDGLKRTNDLLGHGAGDDLLKRTADALRKTTRESDVASRIGGDEFGVLLVGCDVTQVDTAVERMRLALAEAGVAASIGACARQPAGGLEAAFAEADVMMLTEKRRGRRGRDAA